MNINKIIKNEKLILFFILLLVIYLLNLDINTEKKLSLMIVGLLVCIYDTKMIIPYTMSRCEVVRFVHRLLNNNRSV